MKLALPTKPIPTAYAETNTNNNNFYNFLTELTTVLNEQQSYSTTPQRIGTWIDGTPVWRVAFDEDINNMNTDSQSVEFVLAITKTENNVRILTTKLFSSSGYNLQDQSERAEDIVFNTNSSQQGCLNIIFTNNTPEDVIHGYIEFATPESNLIFN